MRQLLLLSPLVLLFAGCAPTAPPGRPADIASLVRDLGDGEAAVRDRAEQLLRALGEEALPELERGAEDGDVERRTRSATLLAITRRAIRLTGEVDRLVIPWLEVRTRLKGSWSARRAVGAWVKRLFPDCDLYVARWEGRDPPYVFFDQPATGRELLVSSISDLTQGLKWLPREGPSSPMPPPVEGLWLIDCLLAATPDFDLVPGSVKPPEQSDKGWEFRSGDSVVVVDDTGAVVRPAPGAGIPTGGAGEPAPAEHN